MNVLDQLCIWGSQNRLPQLSLQECKSTWNAYILSLDSRRDAAYS